MNLQRLRYLVAVADAPSLSAAARGLGISQPVLSRAIRQLERELDLPVVVRDGRRLRVHPAAASVVHAARYALAAVERVRVTASRRLDDALVIAASPTHQALLTPLLSTLSDQTTTVIRLASAHLAEDLCHLVRTGAADIGFGEEFGTADDLDVHRLGELELVVVAAVDTDLPEPVDLGDGPLAVAVVDDPDRFELLARIVANAGGCLEPAFKVGDRSVLMRAVEAGVAPTILPRSLVTANPLLAQRSLRPRLSYRVGAVTHPDAETTVGEAAVRALAAIDWR